MVSILSILPLREYEKVAPMLEVTTEFLFEMQLQTPGSEAVEIGQTPYGQRRVVKVIGGEFTGPRLSGRILGGDDWLLLFSNDVLSLDCRMVMETDDGHRICMTYSGRRHGPQEVIERINRGEEVAASEYYHRIAPFFETASEPYSWLNGIVSVGIGHKRPWGGLYSIHQVL
jgi:hypothetical protein